MLTAGARAGPAGSWGGQAGPHAGRGGGSAAARGQVVRGEGGRREASFFYEMEYGILCFIFD
jgi:hypothetical protein